MEINPDIVVMCDNGLKSFLLPFIIKKRKPLIYERHITKYKKEKFEKSSFLNTIKDRVKSIYMDFCAARYDKFITVIPEGAAEWKGNNIEVIPNPLWLVIDKSSELKNKRIISIGRHAYEKGYDRLFEVWKQVLSKYPDWQLDIYGDKNNDYDIEKIAIESGLTKGVNFYEPVLDIESVYLDASIYLMTSRYEGFGMVLLEAMACGVPCVAFDCPVGPKNIISDAEDGFLIPDDNMDLFISRVEELIKNEELRVNMGRNSKVNVKKFTLEPIMKRWDDLFKSLIENHKEHR
ncbi:glycosyltransferase [uncultured Flavobacterium sp.]|uniref:glycosyltransferase n=1 Tax=uncultured Flavobacterium sp. TaxID=165435 RepID=UPI0025F97EA5|nr:glycosyltransferase [uncultured Flavobacterium sp.]